MNGSLLQYALLRDHPDGCQVASSSLVRDVELDDETMTLLAQDEDRVIRLIARRTRIEAEDVLDRVDEEVRHAHNLDARGRLYFFEIERGDASEFEDTLRVRGERIGKHSVCAQGAR